MKPKQSHTPGPWKIAGGQYRRIIGADNSFIGQILSESDSNALAPTDPTAIANAALIAAAPELLGQLKNAAAELRCAAEILRRAKVTGWNTTLTIAERAEAAIAKAEGREG